MQRKDIQVIDTIKQEVWDSHVTHPMQSYAWGEARKEMGIEVLRLGVFIDEQLTEAYQMTVHKIPYTPYAIGYIPRSGVPHKDVIDMIARYGRNRKIVFIKWESYVEEEKSSELKEFMKTSSHGLFTEWNLQLDLTPSVDALLAGCTKNTRYGIRHAEKKGVEVEEISTDEGFEIFLDLYFKTCKRQNYHGHTKTFHRVLWRHLSRAGIARIYIARVEGKPHTAFQIFNFHDRTYYPHSGSSGEDRKIPASALLMWQVIQDAKESGSTTLDLWGSLPPEHDKDHPWAGFTFFKKSFGAEFVHMSPSYDQVIYPFLYALYSYAYALRKVFLKLRTH